MNIAATQFSLIHNSFEVYLSGCNGSCKNCHNESLKDYSIGVDYTEKIDEIREKINDFYILIRNIWILGGEPLDQNLNNLTDMIIQLKKLNKDIWLFTRYEIEEIPKEVLDLCDYVKTGKYIPELITENNIQYGIKLATSNQKIINLKEKNFANKNKIL